MKAQNITPLIVAELEESRASAVVYHNGQRSSEAISRHNRSVRYYEVPRLTHAHTEGGIAFGFAQLDEQQIRELVVPY